VTLHATHDRQRQTVTFHVSYGPVSVQVEEADGHAFSFWHELGKLIAVEDNEERAEAGYYRFHAALGDGAPPRFRRLPQAQQAAWVAAFTE
jgi:hypothetical protein